MDEGDAKINSPKLFACPNEGCIRVYKRYGSMVNHVTYGKCEFQPERESLLRPVSRKSRKLFGPEKPFVRLRSAYSVKLIFSYVVKRIKIKITKKFRASRRLSCEDTKRIMSPEMPPKSFGTFEKQVPGLGENNVQQEALGR